MLMQSKYIFNNWVQVQNIYVHVYTYLIYYPILCFIVFGTEIVILDFSSLADQHIAQNPQGPFCTSHNHYSRPLLRLHNLITVIIRWSDGQSERLQTIYWVTLVQLWIVVKDKIQWQWPIKLDFPLWKRSTL